MGQWMNGYLAKLDNIRRENLEGGGAERMALLKDLGKLSGKGIETDAQERYLNRAREKVDVFEAARSWSAQIVDEVIHPARTRQKIIEALALTRGKKIRLPARAKTHGVSPS